MTKTIDEVKAIWKKSLIEAASENFKMIEGVAQEEIKKPELNPNNIEACMAHLQAKMEDKLKANGINDEDIPIIKEHGKEWVTESIDWIFDLVMDTMKPRLNEAIIKNGGEYGKVS